MVILYGSDLVELYTSLMKMAEKHFHLDTDLIWLPIILLLAVHVVVGPVSAFIGIAAGQSLLKNTISISAGQTAKSLEPIKKQTTYFPFSTQWLILNILLLISSVLLHVYAPLWAWILLRCSQYSKNLIRVLLLLVFLISLCCFSFALRLMVYCGILFTHFVYYFLMVFVLASQVVYFIFHLIF